MTASAAQTPDDRCLQCGETKGEVKANGLECEIWGGYEYYELEYEWPRHRWAAWRDAELTAVGIKPEALDKYRQTPALDMEWLACDDLIRGHKPVTTADQVEIFGGPIGRCMLCGRVPEFASEARS